MTSAVELAPNENYIICPVCKKGYKALTQHTIATHNMGKIELIELGVTEFYTSKVREARAKGGRAYVIGHLAKIDANYLHFPKECWLSDCKYARVIVNRQKRQIEFNPIIKKVKGVKSLQNHGSKRFRIHIQKDLLGGLEIARPIIELRDRAGFIIQFLEDDDGLFDPFEFWIKHGTAMKSVSKLSTFTYYKRSNCITLADHIWPGNAEYVYLEWQQATRKNGNSFLDLIPVSRTGFIVSGSKNEFKQYIGIEDCVRLSRDTNRLRIISDKFLIQNNIPSGDWHLKEILPSGALRFRLYKERQPKEQSEDIAS